MGCDIHSIVQVKIRDTWDTIRIRPDDDRDYHTFAILADVRNGVGFAGVKTGDTWPFISEPKGLPHDLKTIDEQYVPCPTCHGEDSRIWLGDHSHSHVTLEELKNMEKKLDKMGGYNQIGVLTVEDYVALRDSRREPESWCGWTSGPGIVVAQDEYFDSLCEAEKKNITHVQTSWLRQWRKAAWSYSDYVEFLEKVKKRWNKKDDEVRLVFGFDS